MTNQCDVTLSDGRAYPATTDRHHAEHSDPAVRQHILDVIKQSVAGITDGVVVGYMHRGRK